MSIKSKIRLLMRKFGIDIARYNTSQSEEARIYAQLSHNAVDCVLDVGANDGGYGKFLRSAGFKGTIVSFEPQAAAHRKLLQASRSDPFWHVAAPMALGGSQSVLEINLAGNSASSSLLAMLPSHAEAAPSSKYTGKEKVEVRRLDDVDLSAIRDAKKIFLKIDTQGYEKPVLLGSTGLIDRVVGVQLEMSVIPLYDGQALYPELSAWLDEAGFELWGILPGFMNQTTGRMLQFDGIFFRKP